MMKKKNSISQFDELMGYHLQEAYQYRRKLGAMDDHGRELARRAGERYAATVHFFFQAEDSIRALYVTGVQTCALPICAPPSRWRRWAWPTVCAIGPASSRGAS